MTDRRRCPSDELLIGYVNGDLSDQEQLRIDDHIGTCDRCIATVFTVHARLRVMSEKLLAAPAAMLKRAQAALAEPPPASEAHLDVEQSRRLPAVSKPLSMLLRLPILIPASLAVGALLVVATQTWLAPARPRVLIRAVQIQQTTREAIVRAQPHAEARTVASLNPGEMVEVRGEQSGWYRVALPNGSEGWVERDAFE